RTQCQRLRLLALRAGTVLPREHLFGDNVRVLAHAAGKELRVFENGRTDFVEVIEAEDIATGLLHVLPECGLRRQQVAGSAHGFDGIRHYLPASSFRYCAV